MSLFAQILNYRKIFFSSINVDLRERTTTVEHGLCELDGKMYGHVSGGSLSSCLFTFVVLHLKDRAVFFTEVFFYPGFLLSLK